MGSAFCMNCRHTVELQQLRGKKVCPACHAIDPKTCLPPETRIAGFEICGLLGSGGMGVVYKANQRNLERFVALKVLNDTLAADREFVARFFREARAAAALSHPNIVQAYDAGIGEEGICFFAMELIEGKTFDLILDERGALPEAEVKTLALKVANALDYAWERQQLSHGDIKPENLIQDDLMGVKLSDLGLAKSSKETSGEHEDVMATPLYAPPEIVAGKIKDANLHSDMYSFGATLYHMLSGTPLYPENDPYRAAHRHITDTYRPLTEFGISPSFSAVIDVLLKKNPNERPVSWAAVLTLLEKVIPGQKSEVSPLSRLKKRPLWIYGAIAAMTLVIISLVVTLFLLPSEKKISVPNVKPDPYQQAWKKLNPIAQNSDLSRCLVEITEFERTLPKDHPLISEVQKQLKNLNRQIVESEKNAKIKAEQLRVENIKLKKEVDCITTENYTNFDDNRLKQFEKEVADLVKKINKQNEFPAEPRFRLGALEGKISKELARRQSACVEAAYAQTLPPLRKNEEKLRNIMTLHPPSDSIETRLMYDQLYPLAAQILAQPKNERLKTTQALTKSRSEDGTAPITLNPAFRLLEEASKSPDAIQQVLAQYFSVFKDRQVPASFPESLKGYQFDGIAKDGRVRLSQKNPGATLLQFTTWKEIGYEGISDMVNLFIANTNLAQLPEEIRHTLLINGCLYARKDNSILLQRTFAKTKDPYSVTASELLTTFENCQEVVPLYDTYVEAMNALTEKDYPRAAALLSSAAKNDSSPQFQALYAQNIPDLMRFCNQFAPVTQYADFIHNNKESPILAMTLFGRYESLNALSSQQYELKRRFEKALSELKGRPYLASFQPEKIPYLSSSPEGGETLAMLENMREKDKNFYNPVTREQIKAAAAMDAGAWRPIRTLHNNQKSISLSDSNPVEAAWGMSTGFASAYAAFRLNDLSSFEASSQTLIRQSKTLPEANTLLAELALLRGDFESAKRYADVWINRSNKIPSVRRNYLRLLAELQCREKSNPEQIAGQILHSLRNDKIENDAYWVNFVCQGLSAECWVISAEGCRKLLDHKPLAPDLCVRTVMTAIAYRIERNQPLAAEWNQLFPLMESMIPQNTIGAVAWEDYVNLRLSVALEQNIFFSELSSLMRTPGVQTLPGYHRLLLLDHAARLSCGFFSPKGAAHSFSLYVDGSALAPAWTVDAEAVFTSGDLFSSIDNNAFNASESAAAIYPAALLIQPANPAIQSRTERIAPAQGRTQNLLIKRIRQSWK